MEIPLDARTHFLHSDVITEVIRYLCWVDAYALRLTYKHAAVALRVPHHVMLQNVVQRRFEADFLPASEKNSGFLDRAMQAGYILSGAFLLSCLYNLQWSTHADLFGCSDYSVDSHPLVANEVARETKRRATYKPNHTGLVLAPQQRFRYTLSPVADQSEFQFRDSLDDGSSTVWFHDCLRQDEQTSYLTVNIDAFQHSIRGQEGNGRHYRGRELLFWSVDYESAPAWYQLPSDKVKEGEEEKETSPVFPHPRHRLPRTVDERKRVLFRHLQQVPDMQFLRIGYTVANTLYIADADSLFSRQSIQHVPDSSYFKCSAWNAMSLCCGFDHFHSWMERRLLFEKRGFRISWSHDVSVSIVDHFQNRCRGKCSRERRAGGFGRQAPLPPCQCNVCVFWRLPTPRHIRLQDSTPFL